MPSGEVHKIFYRMAGLDDVEAARLQYFIDGASQDPRLGPRHRSVNHTLGDFIPYLITHVKKGRNAKGRFVSREAKAMQLTAAFMSHVLLDSVAKDARTKAMLELLPALQKAIRAS